MSYDAVSHMILRRTLSCHAQNSSNVRMSRNVFVWYGLSHSSSTKTSRIAACADAVKIVFFVL